MKGMVVVVHPTKGGAKKQYEVPREIGWLLNDLKQAIHSLHTRLESVNSREAIVGSAVADSFKIREPSNRVKLKRDKRIKLRR